MKYKIMTLMLVSLALVACEEEGPAERFGEQLDNAAYELEGAARDAADEIDGAATDAANAVEDACEDVSNRNC